VHVTRISIGGVLASAKPTIVQTLLGSCVAACLFDAVAAVGGMNHFLLPDGSEDHGLPTRYGVAAMEVLINEIAKRGGQRGRLQAKVFGAAHVLRGDVSAIRVPDENARFIREFLATERIPVLGEKLGGRLPLQVRFLTHTGQAFVREVETATLDRVAENEQRWRRAVTAEARRAGDVTLF
jgi:chemotaxis receptor (MCP) glutamine deamidase CheD